MRLPLKRHPQTPASAVDAIDVTVSRPAKGVLALDYRAAGRITGVSLPPPTVPLRTDGLWRTTCFEAFLKPDGGEAYLELNFAPSSEWAAYRFTSYRDGMASLEIPTPTIDARRGDDAFELGVTLHLVGLLSHVPFRLALSAVIEETSGAKSYWALAHLEGRPDFHHAAGFVAALP